MAGATVPEDELNKVCKEMFLMYVEKCSPGAKGETLGKSSVVQKLLKEACSLALKNSQYMDASIFPKYQDKATKKVTADQFLNHLLPDLAGFMSNKKDEQLISLKNSIYQKHKELMAGTTQKNAAVVDRLTDVKGYTGSHKERFDAATGKGKGMEGRVDKQDGSGYVGNYKGAGTYDKSH